MSSRCPGETVSVRLTVSNAETLVANATRRALRHGEKEVVPRVSDLDALASSTAGKVEIEALEEGRDEQIIEHLLRSAVLANTTARYPDAAAATWAARIAAVEQGGMAAVADAVVERYLGPDYRAAHPAETAALKAKLLRSDPAGYVGCCHAIAKVDWLDRLGAVRVPTLVIAGGKDVGATPEMARAIAERIPGAQLAVFEEAAHLSVAELPDRFHATVAAFLASLKMPVSS